MVKSMPTIDRINQISITVSDLDRAVKFYSDVFHVAEWKIFTPEYAERTLKGKPGNFRIKVAVTQLENLELELVQLLEGEIVNGESIQTHGGGLHHVATFVTDIGECIMRMKKLGFEVVQSGKRPGAEFAYLQNTEERSIIIEVLKRSAV